MSRCAAAEDDVAALQFAKGASQVSGESGGQGFSFGTDGCATSVLSIRKLITSELPGIASIDVDSSILYRDSYTFMCRMSSRGYSCAGEDVVRTVVVKVKV